MPWPSQTYLLHRGLFQEPPNLVRCRRPILVLLGGAARRPRVLADRVPEAADGRKLGGLLRDRQVGARGALAVWKGTVPLIPKLPKVPHIHHREVTA